MKRCANTVAIDHGDQHDKVNVIIPSAAELCSAIDIRYYLQHTWKFSDTVLNNREDMMTDGVQLDGYNRYTTPDRFEVIQIGRVPTHLEDALEQLETYQDLCRQVDELKKELCSRVEALQENGILPVHHTIYGESVTANKIQLLIDYKQRQDEKEAYEEKVRQEQYDAQVAKQKLIDSEREEKKKLAELAKQKEQLAKEVDDLVEKHAECTRVAADSVQRLAELRTKLSALV